MKQLYYAIQMIIRGKDSSIIKIISLTLGLLISIILFARVAFELSYDNFYEDTDRLFIVRTAWVYDGKKDDVSEYNIYPTAQTIAEHFPEAVESYTTVVPAFGESKLYHGKNKYPAKIIAGDSLYFRTMGIKLYSGNAYDLSIPDVIFLSQSFAREIFGSEDPMGKTLVYNSYSGGFPVIVKGVFADIPENVSLERFKAVLSSATEIKSRGAKMGWTSGGNFNGFVRLKDKRYADEINKGINSKIANYIPREHYGFKGNSGIEVSIAPLRNNHLENENVKKMIYMMLLLGSTLLITATLNYVLISISSLSYRAKAIGVHKCNGAGTMNILGMFVYETALIIGLALLCVVFLILNFQEKIEFLTDTSLEGLFNLHNLWAPALVIFILFVIGGLLPGKIFSSIPVTQVFHRYAEGKKRWKYPLLFIQFGCAAFLVGMMCVVYLQYQYTINKDLGYNPSGVAYVYHKFENPDNAVTNFKSLPYVENVATAETSPLSYRAIYSVCDNNGNVLFIPRSTLFDKDYLSFMQMKLKAGRNLDGEGQILVNEPFVRKMGWTGSGVGEVVKDHGTVVGVINHFGFSGSPVDSDPVEFRWSATPQTTIHVRLKAPFDENLNKLNEETHRLYPQDDIWFRSLEGELRGLNLSTAKFRDSIFLAALAVLAITLMGLVGYTNDEVRRRSKEIAIRKINGAKVQGILLLISRDVMLIAVPAVLIGVVGMDCAGNLWLSQFRDPLSVGWTTYLGVGIGILLFIIGIVIWKSWAIANENPVNSIKSE